MHNADAQCQSAGSWYITVGSVPNGVTVVDLVFDQAEAYETGYKPSANTWEVNYSGGTLSGYVLFSNDFRAYFSGSGDCTIVVPPPPPPVKPPVCHPVNGNGETGTGWNIIGPDQASSHIDDNLYPDGEYWKHMSNDGRHDVYAENGQCPAPPVDL